ncbi:S8 family serine peptidase [Arthrobacter halodurans]|uniref:S8 family serine peptidase n=1 Tax=Arthrobacter halodurans TaxID=516699 RepID=A0ABV4UNE3_9MICC
MNHVSGQGGRLPKWRAVTAVAMGLPLLVTMGLGAQQAVGAPLTDTVESAPPALESFKDGNYIVLLKADPVASYDGGVAGIAATKPAKGKKLDMRAPNVKAYEAHLKKRQKAVAATQSVSAERTFTTAVNGFQADLTAEQAAELAKDKNVLSVSENVQYAPDYSSTDFLELRGKGGTWDTTYGGEGFAGKGVVVGVIDTGYEPGNAFLAGAPVRPLAPGASPAVGVPYRAADGQIAMLKSDGTTFKGECQVGEDFDGSLCNDKVVSARYFADDFTTYVPEANRAEEEVISPVDIGSHGTHTASTAAGNNNVKQVVDGRDFGSGSGVAPSAKVSVYKVCWEDKDPNTGGCYSSASVQAIEAAIVDGVDVLNYSISGNNNSFVDPVAMAFKNAAAAGVFVAASAGNSGPTVSTVNHASPWLTTVAAATFTSGLNGTVEMEDGTKYRGVSIAPREVEQTELVLAADAALAGAAKANLCLPGTIDPAKADGKIVVCDRGENARAEKSTVVGDAGAVGMVLVNVTAGSEDSDMHAVPTVHITGTEIKDQIAANPGITAALRNTDTTDLPATTFPQIAAFSSRGPSLAANSDLLKPDVAAPGVNVLAGVVPAAYAGNNYGFMSGTSMSAPHVAGFGALMLGKNPLWSPAAVKSAMMTTANDAVTADGSADTDNFATGAGMVDPKAMANPGLVYDHDVEDWNALINGEIQARDMNVASYALGGLAGEITVTRSVTALVPGKYTASANVPGVDVKVTPSKLTFKPGETKSFKVTFRNATAAAEKFTHGSLTWDFAGKGRGISVTSPVSVRPVTVVAPSVATFSGGAAGSGSIEVLGGVDKTVDLSVDGLAKADGTVIEKVPGLPLVLGSNASTGFKPVTVPAGATSATFAVNADDQADDWDLALYNAQTGAVLQAATASASEQIVLKNPAPGQYYIIGNLYATNDGGPATASLDFVALQGDAGNLTVTPDPLALTNGGTSTIDAAWSGLSTGTYFGSVVLGETGKAIAVQVNVGTSAAPAAEPLVVTGEDFAKLPKSTMENAFGK